MRVLFDNGTPRTLARYLIERHSVTEARARGWAQLENGELLNAAETAGLDVRVTTDKNLRYQQNLARRKIALGILGKGRWSLVKPHVARCARFRSTAWIADCLAWVLSAEQLTDAQRFRAILTRTFAKFMCVTHPPPSGLIAQPLPI